MINSWVKIVNRVSSWLEISLITAYKKEVYYSTWHGVCQALGRKGNAYRNNNNIKRKQTL